MTVIQFPQSRTPSPRLDTLDAEEMTGEEPGFYARWKKSRDHLLAAHPGGLNVVAFGRHAWNLMSQDQRVKALDDLFYAYACRIFDEEAMDRLDAEVKAGKTHLGPGDEHMLRDAVIEASDRRLERIDVDAVALCNVLDELQLLRHRLTTGGEA